MIDLLWEKKLNGEASTTSLGQFLGQIIPGSTLLALRGDLGAGKTTFTQGLARGLGIPPSVAIQSPTYNLLHTYQGRLTLHHLDFYRLTHPDELFELGFEDLQQPDSLTVVEWADRFEGEIPSSALWIELQYLDEASRKLSLRGDKARWMQLVAQLQSL